MKFLKEKIMADITYYKKIFHPRIEFHPFRIYLWEFIFDFETKGLERLDDCLK